MRRVITEHESVISASNRVERYPEYERLAVSWPKEGMWSVCLPLALGSVKSVSAL